jgi:hypothetical protein
MSAACNHCGEPLNVMLLFCEHCGAVQANSVDFECETHTDRSAIGMCVVCYKTVCEVCQTTSGKKFLCSDPSHQQMINDWSVVHQVESEFEADAIQQNLKATDIESKAFSLHDFIAAHFIPANHVTVWVRQQELQKAIKVLTDLDLIAQVSQS